MSAPLKRALKLVILSGLVWTLLLAVSLALLRWRDAHKLSAWKAEMRSRGELLSLQDIWAHYPRTAEPTLPYLSNLVSRMRTLPFAMGDVSLMTSSGPGYALPAAQAPCWLTLEGARLEWAQVATNLAAAKPLLDELHAFLHNPPSDSGWETSGKLSPGRFGISHYLSGYWIAASVILELHATNYSSAFDLSLDLLRLCRLYEDDPLPAHQLQRASTVALAHSVTWELLQARDWDDLHLQQISAAWLQIEVFPKWVRTLEMERARSLHNFDGARTSLPSCWSSTNSLTAQFNRMVYAPAWRLLWSPADELHYLQPVQDDLQFVRRGAHGDPLARVRLDLAANQRRFHSPVNRLCAYKFPLSQRSYSDSVQSLERPMRAETLRGIALAAVAAKRYQLKHGRLPAELDQLVPEFLPELPRDRMTGRTLTYSSPDDHSVFFQSAGLNGIAEDGLGDDLSWPLAGPPPPLAAPVADHPSLISFDAIPLRSIILSLAHSIGLKPYFDPACLSALDASDGSPLALSFQLEGVTTLEALHALLDAHGLALVRPAGASALYFTRKPLLKATPEESAPRPLQRGHEETAVPLIVIDEVPLLDALRNVARQSGVNILFDARLLQMRAEGSEPTIRLRYEDVSAEETMRRILKSSNLTLRRAPHSTVTIVAPLPNSPSH